MSRKLFFLIAVGLLVGATTVQAGYDKVAYWDDNYPTNWADAASALNVRDALEAAGYRIVNADELKTWMDGHIADKKLSVVIMCNDIFPDTVAETDTEDCTLRQYLNAGGKIVFYADIPFWNQGHAGGTNTNWGQAGSTGILGFSSAPNAAPASWDQNSAVTITDAGVEWGLTETWSSVRPTAADAWPDMTVLAVDASGNPVGWAAHYVSGDTFRGFVRIRDVGGMPNVDDLIRLAEYGNIVGLALNPAPDDEATDVLRDINLSWLAGEYAATHNVYFGTNWDDVNDGTGDVTVSMGQMDTGFDPGRLEFGQTYYWRVDEVNAAPDNSVYKGDVWSFEVEPVSYPIPGVTATASSSNAGMGPEKTVDGSGLNELDQHSALATDMWLSGMGDPAPSIQYAFDKAYKLDKLMVWNSNQLIESFVGLGAKDVTIETSLDGTEWTALEGPIQFNQATGSDDYTANTTIDFGGVMAQQVRITVNSGWGMLPQYGLSEVRFFYIPTFAREPMPTDGAVTDSINVVLGWRAGREAATHEVSLGTDPANLTRIATVTDNSLDLADQDLQFDTTYYWQVREVNETETPTAHDGPVWSFTIPPYGTVDDFETYNDLCNRIFFAWKDGLGHNGGEEVDNCDEPPFNGNGGGSIVGNAQAPFAEKTIVSLGSAQSMPFDYDNAFGDSYATLAIPGEDWSAHSIKTLSLAFRGESGNTGTLYVKINNTKISYDGPATDIAVAGWQTWNIVLADTGASLSNVTSLQIGVDGASAAGKLYIDNIRLYPKVFAAPTSSIDIAISSQANWWTQAAADREMQEIIDNVPAPVLAFTAGDQAGLADWVTAHTSNGVSNLLILCGQLPDTIYEPGNLQVDDSIIEQFLDAGNTVINTGDWIFYVVNGAGTNGAAGLQTIMDIPGVTVAGEDNTDVTVTAEGQQYTPSLQDFATDRPFHLDTLEGDWSTELVLAQNAADTRADPVIVHNSATGGRIGIFYQAANEDNDPRGEVISEWINNWYLPTVSGGN